MLTGNVFGYIEHSLMIFVIVILFEYTDTCTVVKILPCPLPAHSVVLHT